MRTLPLLMLAALGCRGNDTAFDTSIGIDPDTQTDSDSDSEALDVDGDGVTVADGDCDDADADVFPGADELCNGIDDNCSLEVDEAPVDATTWYADADGDGVGDESETKSACEKPSGYAAMSGDCDDTNAAVYPGAPEADCTDPVDYNCDGAVGFADADSDGFPACEDCNDTDAAINSGATELCDDANVDENCDGAADDAGATGESTWYADADGDGFGDAATAQTACDAPPNTIADGTDCDDAHAEALPGGSELCDGLDNDCNGTADDEPSDQTQWFRDVDGDGAGDDAQSVTACDKPGDDYVTSGGDCDDANPAALPGGTEVCDEADNDCNGSADDGLTVDVYVDADGDGFGTGSLQSEAGCAPASGFSLQAGDCDDSSAAVNPSATETCNELDDNCAGGIDEGVKSTFYLDTDGDDYGTDSSALQGCAAPSSYVDEGGDCDDTNELLNPGATEVNCDGIDNNCDDETDPDGLVVHFAFEEGGGTAVEDSSGNSIDGTHNAAYGSGQSGGALDFAGGARAEIDGAEWGDGVDYTVSYWVYDRTGPTGLWRGIVHRGQTNQDRNVGHFFDPSTNAIAPVGSIVGQWNYYRYSPILPVGEWVHFAHAVQGDQYLLYVNGAEVVRETMPGAPVNTSGTLTLGRDYWYGPFDGLMDEFRVYCYGQSEAQVQSDISADGG